MDEGRGRFDAVGSQLELFDYPSRLPESMRRETVGINSNDRARE